MPKIIDRGGCILPSHCNDTYIPLVDKIDNLNLNDLIVIAEFGINVAQIDKTIENSYSSIQYYGSVGLQDCKNNKATIILVITAKLMDDGSKENIIYTATNKMSDGPYEVLSFISSIGTQNTDIPNSHCNVSDNLHEFISAGYYRFRLYVAQVGIDSTVRINGPVTIQAISYICTYVNTKTNMDISNITPIGSVHSTLHTICTRRIESSSNTISDITDDLLLKKYITNNRKKVYTSKHNGHKGSIIPYSSSYNVKLGSGDINKYIEIIGNGVSTSIVYNKPYIDKDTVFGLNELGKIFFIVPKNGAIGNFAVAFTPSKKNTSVYAHGHIAIKVAIYKSTNIGNKYTDYTLSGDLELNLSSIGSTVSAISCINDNVKEKDRICVIAYNIGNYSEGQFYTGIIEGNLSAGITFI